MKRALTRNEAGFWLLEALLAVAIFAIGVLSLGQAVNNCLVAQYVMQDDSRARLALANRMAEIEAGSVQIGDNVTTDLKDAFDGMKMKQTRVPVKKKNEKEQDITGIWAITLEVGWKADGKDLTRQLSFYYMPRRTGAGGGAL
jgi:type II secretion system protein I